jgi:hypothetical protein
MKKHASGSDKCLKDINPPSTIKINPNKALQADFMKLSFLLQ